MIIDVHGHLVPPDLLAAIRKEQGRFPSLRLVEDGGMAIAFAGGKPSRPIMKGLSDTAARLSWMDKQGIDRQVVGGWPDWFGYELPPAEGEAWCQLFNEAQLAAARFGFGALLHKHLLAFADHAAEFYRGSGNDWQRALELSRVNAANRPTRRALRQAHTIAADMQERIHEHD